jgi:hypothetical protein
MRKLYRQRMLTRRAYRGQVRCPQDLGNTRDYENKCDKVLDKSNKLVYNSTKEESLSLKTLRMFLTK